MIFANFAKSVAASSDVRFVATSISAIVFVNNVILSVWIPNCPADSAISDNPAAVFGISVAICRISSRISCSCVSVAFTVFFTPANALSNSDPFATAAPNAAAVAVPAATAAVLTALKVLFAVFSRLEKAGSASFNPLRRLSVKFKSEDFGIASEASTACLAIFFNSFCVSFELS